MKITRQESAEDYKLWNEGNLPKAPFVVITPANNETTGGEIERIVIPRQGDEKGSYHLINLFSACVSKFDAKHLAVMMNSAGAYAVEAVIRGNISMSMNGKKSEQVVREGFLRKSSINVIKSKVKGYCLILKEQNNPYATEILYTVIPLNGNTPWNISVRECHSEISNGTLEFVEDSEIVISNVNVSPNSY